MNKEQAEVLNVVQEVLRAMTTSLLATNPAATDQVARALQAFADAPGVDPMASAMLRNLAAGPAMLAGAGKLRQ